MIRHAALFRLHHPSGSREQAFLTRSARSPRSPALTDFAIAREVSPKNGSATRSP